MASTTATWARTRRRSASRPSSKRFRSRGMGAMKNRILAVAAVAATLCTGALVAQQARNSRPAYPANAEKVSYAELDKLPDWRGIWQPNMGRIGGDQPQLLGKYKK